MISFEEIESEFYASKMRKFAMKPKIFFYDCCRGSQWNSVIETQISQFCVIFFAAVVFFCLFWMFVFFLLERSIFEVVVERLKERKKKNGGFFVWCFMCALVFCTYNCCTVHCVYRGTKKKTELCTEAYVYGYKVWWCHTLEVSKYYNFIQKWQKTSKNAQQSKFWTKI